MDVEDSTSPPKKLKSPLQGLQDGTMNPKTSVICSKVPDSLFEVGAAEKHFHKFGKVQRIKLYRRRQMCLVEFDQPKAAELAVLNAGAYDGFMFDVSRRVRVRRKSKKDDDPDWVPDPEVQAELSAMSGAPSYRFTRQKSMEIDPAVKKRKPPITVNKFTHVKKRTEIPVRSKPIIPQSKFNSAIVPTVIEPPLVAPPASMSNQLSTAEAAAELYQLSFRVSLTPDEKWRVLDARDKILRSWGGAGSRVKVGGATIGTCPDMCPEKELLHRQCEHQVMTLETVIDSDGVMEPWRAVKQYSRSSADQEIPMCYELRPASVLMRTCAYLLYEIADTTRQVSLPDWFHFMWDRLRSIRKDITQQALCCAESIRLVEMCARFHAHCAARLADLEHTQFDQKLNTDNLTKCLQTLKHMYDDVEVRPEQKPHEAEFRGYIALLNLGDSNFLWEVKHLPREIQKSDPIVFAIKVFIALDNNNYVRFFRLVNHKATYLQACILLRYFNDVRARALARIVKGFSPRGSSRYPAEELMNTLAFESIESMKSFVTHYGLRLTKTDTEEISVILNRNQFIEDSDPYPIARAKILIESKRKCTVGEVIAGGKLPMYDFTKCILHSSFNSDGKLKHSSLTAEDLGYNTINDSNKDVQGLKAEVHKLLNGSKSFAYDNTKEIKGNILNKSEHISNTSINNSVIKHKGFAFQPAISIAPKETVNTCPGKMLGTDTKKLFTFSKPKESPEKEPENIFNLFTKTAQDNKSIFGSSSNDNATLFKPSQNLFQVSKSEDIDRKATFGNSIFNQKVPGSITDKPQVTDTKNIFSSANTKFFTKDTSESQSIFKPVQGATNVFGKPNAQENGPKSSPSNIFGTFRKPTFSEKPSVFNPSNDTRSGVVANGDSVFSKSLPGNLFKNALQPAESETKSYSIFQSKNKPTVANSIFNSVNNRRTRDIYDFDQNADEDPSDFKLRETNEQKIEKDAQLEMSEKLRKEEVRQHEEERRKDDIRREQERLKEEDRRRVEEKLREEERRREQERQKEEERRKEADRLKLEEKIQQQLRDKLEKERKAELKRKAEEAEKKLREKAEKESVEILGILVDEIENETVELVLKEEREKFNKVMHYANETADSIFSEVCNDICNLEIKAELFLNKRLTTKWFKVWKKQVERNLKRRRLLEDTPVWLPDNTPDEEACFLRRQVEKDALRNMNAIHRGYRFNGELKQLPYSEPYNILEIIRSPLLKRVKQISYPYDKCFFWKVTLLSPGPDKWFCRQVHLNKWLIDAFSDKKSHNVSSSLIHVSKQSWNNLMNFGISVCLINREQKRDYGEAIDGSNSLLLYVSEYNINDVLDEIVKQKFAYQVIPVAIITSIPRDCLGSLEMQLIQYKHNKAIFDYKMYVIDPSNVINSLETNTKRALKWLAKNYQKPPSIEIDYLKSICQRYLGNEIWYKLKSEQDVRMNIIHKDLNKLIDCYNIALEKLTKVITNEDLFNYPSFPLEFKEYLDSTSPYPKPYEFISSSVKNSENTDAVKEIMNHLRLPKSALEFRPANAYSLQEQIHKYCRQIGWFENPEKVVCKVIALLPDGRDIQIPYQNFDDFHEHYDLIDLLNIIVYEKINNLRNFENRFAIYEKSALEDYHNSHWIYESETLKSLKHKAADNLDELDLYMVAKRRKMAIDSLEYVTLEDSDVTLLEENIQAADRNISNYNNYTEVVQQLEQKLDEERKKSNELENLLKAALCDAV